MAHLADFSTAKKYTARVLSSELLTPNSSEEIRELKLELDSGEFDCEVDQSFGVLVKTDGSFGQKFHHRLYSVADIPEHVNGHIHLTMLVKRCYYVDSFSGEKYPGVASNYLCDRKAGDEIVVTGPHGLPFDVPKDKSSNLILVGMGTGIAPFRAFVKYIYHNIPNWEGKIRLFYGARSGLELLYLNDEKGDLTNYYDKETFRAFHALSPRPHWSDPIALDSTLMDKAAEILDMLKSANTYIYVAGYDRVLEHLERAFSEILGSKQLWELRKAELIAGRKWAEVIY